MLFVLKFNSLFTDKGNCSPEAGDVLLITRLDRLARSTRDLLKVLDGVGLRTPADSWADTTTPRGRLMLTVLGGLAEFEAINSIDIGGLPLNPAPEG
jgi:DNA invertase Pin-like site-specific DNA recombinase